MASLALLAFVTWQLLRSAVDDLPTALLGLASLLLLLLTRVGPAWLVLGVGVLGIAFG